jgi:hypothetical protein
MSQSVLLGEGPSSTRSCNEGLDKAGRARNFAAGVSQ